MADDEPIRYVEHTGPDGKPVFRPAPPDRSRPGTASGAGPASGAGRGRAMPGAGVPFEPEDDERLESRLPDPDMDGLFDVDPPTPPAVIGDGDDYPVIDTVQALEHRRDQR